MSTESSEVATGWYDGETIMSYLLQAGTSRVVRVAHP